MTKAICKDMLQIEGHDTVYYSGEEYDVSASILKSHGDYFDVVEKTTKKNASVAKENKQVERVIEYHASRISKLLYLC